MIKIVPDKEGRLTQWDLNRKVIVTGYEGIAEVHFASPGEDTKVIRAILMGEET